MNFKHRKSMKLPYKRQGYIFFKCQNINCLTEKEQREIRNTCDKSGFSDAVFEYITTEATSEDICKQYGLNDKMLSVITSNIFAELSKIL